MVAVAPFPPSLKWSILTIPTYTERQVHPLSGHTDLNPEIVYLVSVDNNRPVSVI